MSYITGKPFITEVLSALNIEQLKEIYNIINSSNPEIIGTIRTYYIGNLKPTLPVEEAKTESGAYYVNLSFDPVSQSYHKGLLISYNNELAFIGWTPKDKNMFEVKLLTQDTYEYINEQLTTEEFRRVLGDLFSGGEGIAPSIPSNQATATVVVNPLTNLNDRVLSAYESELIQDTYPYYHITKGGKELTLDQAADYMEYMTGSRFVPQFNYEKPQNSIWITAEGEFLKPQWGINGMCLYLLPNPFGEGGAKLYKHNIYVEHLVGSENSEVSDEFYFTIYSFYSEPVEGLEDMCDCISSANTDIIICYEGGRDCSYIGYIHSYGNRPIFNFVGLPLTEGESIMEFDSDGE